MRVVSAQPLTAAGFAPFGDVVSAGVGVGNAANQGTAVRFDRCATLTSTRPQATPNLAVFRSVKRSLPLRITLLEKHPCSTQTFLPMVCSRIVVVVAPAGTDGAPDLAGLCAFVGSAGQGVTYGVGVWHHPIVAVDRDADLAMLAWEDGGADDCHEHPLHEPIEIAVPHLT